MSQIKLENIQKAKNPIDVIEEVVLANGWEYDIDENRNIHVEIGEIGVIINYLMD